MSVARYEFGSASTASCYCTVLLWTAGSQPNSGTSTTCLKNPTCSTTTVGKQRDASCVKNAFCGAFPSLFVITTPLTVISVDWLILWMQISVIHTITGVPPGKLGKHSVDSELVWIHITPMHNHNPCVYSLCIIPHSSTTNRPSYPPFVHFPHKP